MANINHHIQSLQSKLQQLLQQYKQLQKENESLKKAAVIQLQKNQSYHEQINTLQQKLHAAQLGNQNLSETDKKELNQKINHYLKEIDKCLSLLHTQ
ncbi:MAG: hypothetical protein JSR09_04115 [Bacteroidetes bacterium]|nr:hypothetical protein [Bacteroidota bacterium]MBS1648871.1 hypothetical protein [Bacteroidota bacterium]